MKTALKYGAILGIVAILVQLALYLVNPDLIFNMKIGMSIGIIYTIAILVLSLKEERKINEGILTFGDGLKTTFITYAIGTFMATIFGYVLMNHIDPSLIDRGIEYSLGVAEKTINMTADLVNMPEAEKDAALEEIRSPAAIEDMRGNFSLNSSILAFLLTLFIPGFLYWLIIPAVMKKNPSGA